MDIVVLGHFNPINQIFVISLSCFKCLFRIARICRSRINFNCIGRTVKNICNYFILFRLSTRWGRPWFNTWFRAWSCPWPTPSCRGGSPTAWPPRTSSRSCWRRSSGRTTWCWWPSPWLTSSPGCRSTCSTSWPTCWQNNNESGSFPAQNRW